MAEGVNKVILVGNLGKDPELSYTQSGTARCRFSLATGESYTNNAGERQQRTEWHNIVVWNKQAENCATYLKKGSSVVVEGKIRTRSWDDNGVTKYRTEVVASGIKFLGTKSGGGHSQPPLEEEPPFGLYNGGADTANGETF